MVDIESRPHGRSPSCLVFSESRTPNAELSAFGSRLSALGFRLSAFGVRLSGEWFGARKKATARGADVECG
jgi:hypothetical protein